MSSGTLRRTARNTYSSHESHNGTICYLSKIETLFGTDGTGKTDYEALSVDEWGNPTEIVENGVHSVLQWCGNGQRLMTRVEGITLEEYEALPELSAHNLFPDVPVFVSLWTPFSTISVGSPGSGDDA